jgi:hypothetical protein
MQTQLSGLALNNCILSSHQRSAERAAMITNKSSYVSITKLPCSLSIEPRPHLKCQQLGAKHANMPLN